MRLLRLLLAAAWLGVAVARDGFFQCFSGFDNVTSPGVSLPRGDTYVRTGSAGFWLHCHLNPLHDWYRIDGLRSDRLFFERAELIDTDGNYADELLDSEIVNATTIRHWYEPPAYLAKDYVDCKVRLGDGRRVRSVCTQLVAAGTEPAKPKNFTCVSENWANINCTWTQPWNPIPTKYNLSFALTGRHSSLFYCPSGGGGGGGGGGPSRANRRPQPVLPFSMYYEKTRGECFMSSRTDPPYRQTLEKYNFLMHYSNPLNPEGAYDAFPVHHYSVVRPGAAVNVTVAASGPNAVVVRFKIPLEMHDFPPGVKNFLRIKSKRDDDGFREVNLKEYDVHAEERTFAVDGLIPHALYAVEVRLLSGALEKEDAGPRLWSEPAFGEGRPLPDVPGRPPSAAPGSFESVDVGGGSRRNVFVYWRQIDARFRNGPNFGYEVISAQTQPRL